MKTMTKGHIKNKTYVENKDEIMDKFVEKAIDTINKRTVVKSLDFEGSKFTKYSPEYAKSKGSKKVNMIKDNYMLASIEEGETTQTNTLKVKLGDDQTLKGYNHMVGDTLPRRSFFGLSEKEKSKIVSDIAKDYD